MQKKNKFETLLPCSTLNPIFKRRREIDKLDVIQSNVLLPPCMQTGLKSDHPSIYFDVNIRNKIDSNKEKFVFITSSSFTWKIFSSLANYSTGQAMVTHRGLHISESCPFMKYTVTFSCKKAFDNIHSHVAKSEKLSFLIICTVMTSSTVVFYLCAYRLCKFKLKISKLIVLKITIRITVCQSFKSAPEDIETFSQNFQILFPHTDFQKCRSKQF